MHTSTSRSLFILVLALSTVLLLASGCRKAPVKNVLNAPISGSGTSQELPKDTIEQSIIVAGASLGWKIRKVSDGMMEGILDIRRHQAVVSIPYDNATYSIQYKGSTNLKYDGVKIHSNYNGWIQNLDRAIQSELSSKLPQ